MSCYELKDGQLKKKTAERQRVQIKIRFCISTYVQVILRRFSWTFSLFNETEMCARVHCHDKMTLDEDDEKSKH